ncbi:TetR/AcrR family transcriptional regulator [Roseateles oligotrophus]|uniref:TetR/AcrR family transcriptional regulator n=1 Tax=Roseateles oligotrophus TaxID=1769250 RepID=A0ABT2YCC8_9BURK|nr:TetR/AcrR family transcriptional regulator [Roseateles oligotrophus]MCV2367692.1 TetR/AcrR family transcriptional regulator [Roseateles oligotrophus]
MKHFSELTASAERIVDAGEALIQRVGYNGFSYEDVAKMVGIRKPSIHHHFPTKIELGVVVAQRYTHRFRQALLHIEGTQARAAERLRAYAQLFETTYAENRRLCVCGMLGAESDSLPAEINAEVRRFFEINVAWLETVIALGQQAGALKVAISAPEWALTLLGALEGAMLVGRGLQSGRGPRQVMDTLLVSIGA